VPRIPLATHPSLRWLLATLGVTTLVFCNRAPLPSAEEQVLTRQIAALEQLVGAAEGGPLLPFGQMLLVVDQGLVQEVVGAVLPLEGDVGGFHIRLEGAEAAFGDGVALLRLAGKASVAGKAASANMVVYGGLDVVEISPESGRLRGRISVYGVEVKEADILGVDERRLTRALAHDGLAALLHFVEVPIRFENTLMIPAVESKRLRIPQMDLPLNARVAGVRVFGGKLWIEVLASTGEGGADARVAQVLP
jgi:hypothetical protein